MEYINVQQSKYLFYSNCLVFWNATPFCTFCIFFSFCARSQNCVKRQLISSCLSVCMEQFGSHWTDFHEIWNSITFRKYVEKIQVSLKSEKNNRHFAWRSIYICDIISLNCSNNEKFFKVLKNIKTFILCPIAFFFEHHVVYEISWKNIVHPDRPQMTIWPIWFACLIPKATNTHSEYVILVAYPRQQRLSDGPQFYLTLHSLSCTRISVICLIVLV